MEMLGRLNLPWVDTLLMFRFIDLITITIRRARIAVFLACHVQASGKKLPRLVPLPAKSERPDEGAYIQYFSWSRGDTGVS